MRTEEEEEEQEEEGEEGRVKLYLSRLSRHSESIAEGAAAVLDAQDAPLRFAASSGEDLLE